MRCLRHGLVLLLALVGARAAWAQPGPCDDVLADAEQRYLEQDYGSVEPFVIECVYRPGVPERQLQQAYRLLALAYIRQDLLADAQLTIVKLLGVDYAYEPDPVADPPFYVSLVSAVKDQLRVEAATVEAAGVDRAASAAAPEAEGADSTDPAPTPSPAEPAAAYEPVVVAPERSAESGAAPARVDINAASAEELESLPGIGPALAARILAYRTDYGAFVRPEDLQNVRGIGPRTIESLLPSITTGAAQPPTAEPASEAAPASGRVDLNTATAAQLDGLPGVGPALAQRIVESREREGPFQRVDDVTRVRGIGPARLAGFRDRVTVDA